MALALGSLTALLPEAPASPGLLVLVLAGGLVLVVPRSSRLLGCCLLALSWAHGHILFQLADRLPAAESRQLVTLQGRVASIPRRHSDQASFEFVADEGSGASRLPRRWLLRWYREPPPLEAGQRWTLSVVAQPPWGRVNFLGEDRERDWLARGIGALGTVRDGQLLDSSRGLQSWALRWRQSVFAAVGAALPDPQRRGIVQALATADRSGLGSEDQAWLRLTGTSHLLAISGLHVGLAAAGTMLLARFLLGLIPLHLGGMARPAVVAVAGLAGALAYAALAGFGLPTLRAVLMLAAVISALLWSRIIAPFQALALALAVTLLLMPLAPLTAGFWLSFLAVTALMLLAVPRPVHRSGLRAIQRSGLRSLAAAQLAVTLFLLPACAAWFGGFSLVSLAANLVAIPWVSFTVVPLVLLGVAADAVAADAPAALAWQAAGASAQALFYLLAIGARWQGELVPLRDVGLLHCILATAGAALLLLPRGLPLRCTGAFLMLPLLAPSSAEPAQAPGLQIEFLDVGQGTAAVIRHGDRDLLYDTGPGDGGDANLVGPVIRPALRAATRQSPDIVVVSHGDLDHAGGLAALRERFPDALYFASLEPVPHGVSPCRAGQELDWGEWRISFLHPGPGLPYLGNDSSCVLRLSRGPRQLLLAGDISAAIEQRLVREGLDPQAVVLVPHHGSLTSSSRAFVDSTKPRVAVATAGPGNRFGFPRPAIRERYLDAGSAFWSTGECGAIRLRLAPDGSLHATSARRARPALWRWPAAPACPLDRVLP